MPTQPLIRLFTTISLVLVTLTTVCFFYQILYLIVPFLVKLIAFTTNIIIWRFTPWIKSIRR